MIKNDLYRWCSAVFLLMLTFTSNTQAQLGTDCADNAGCDVPWSSEQQQILFYIEEIANCAIQVNYQYRICPDGSIQYRLTKVQGGGACDKGIFTDEALMELIQVTVVQRDLNDPPVLQLFFDHIEDCQNGTSTTVQFFNASCYFEQTCTFQLSNPDGSCDPALPARSYSSNQLIKTFWYSCGEACCKREYTVCKEQVGDKWYLSIQNISSSRVGLPCSFYSNTCADNCSP